MQHGPSARPDRKLKVATARVEEWDEATRRTIEGGIVAFNHAQAGFPPSRRFNITLRDGDAVIGGAACVAWRGWLFVDLLWVDERRRGEDHGTAIMDLAEAHGRELGCRFAYLDTFSFQAPGFYAKRGYETFGVLEDFPEGHRRHFMKKTL